MKHRGCTDGNLLSVSLRTLQAAFATLLMHSSVGKPLSCRQQWLRVCLVFRTHPQDFVGEPWLEAHCGFCSLLQNYSRVSSTPYFYVFDFLIFIFFALYLHRLVLSNFHSFLFSRFTLVLLPADGKCNYSTFILSA